MLFQYPVVALVVAVLTDITEAAGVFCQFETKPYFAKLWVRRARDRSDRGITMANDRDPV